MPHRKGAMLVPTTGSWCIAMISGFVRMSTISVETAESCGVQDTSVRSGVEWGWDADVRSDEERGPEERPSGPVRFVLFVREVAVPPGSHISLPTLSEENQTSTLQAGLSAISAIHRSTRSHSRYPCHSAHRNSLPAK